MLIALKKLNNSMKILHIASLGKTGFSGVGSVVVSLQKAQERMGHIVKVVLILDNEITGKNTNFTYIRSYRGFKNYIANFTPDIVIFHSLFYLEYIRYSRFIKKQNIPYIITLHGAGTEQNMNKSKWKKQVALFLLFNRFIRNAAALSFLSNQEKKRNLLKHLCENHIVIPNGIDKISPKQDFKTGDKLRIMFLGRISYYDKALDVLLEAFEIITTRGLDKKISFTFYGPRYNDQLLVDIRPYKSFVAWHEPVYGEEKINAYHENDIYILTSRSEGMPMGVLESLSCGMPCLVTPQTNMAELIKENDAGWVTELGAEQIAHAIERALIDYNERYLQLSINSINAVKKYTWDKIAEDAVCEYQKLIDSRPMR